jgi:hypothetical protein
LLIAQEQRSDKGGWDTTCAPQYQKIQRPICL